MNAWREGNNVMGASVERPDSPKPSSPPPLKNGSDLRESGYLIAIGSRTARFRRKHKSKLLLVTLLIFLLLLLCLAIVMTVLYVRQKRHKPVKLCESKECLRSAANLALSMDKTANPCVDFYQYVCGNWPEEHPRPDAYRSYDWFRDKQTKVYMTVRELLNKNTINMPKPVRQAKDMFTACMDTDTLNKLGVKPVTKVLESIGLPKFPNYINVTEDFDYSTYTFDWLDIVIKVKTQMGMDVLIGFDLYTDPKNSSTYRLVLGSPETTNPFPSIHTDKKPHMGRRNIRHPKTKQTLHEDFMYFGGHHLYKSETKTEEDDDDIAKATQIYKLFYAEVIKLFYSESGVEKPENLSEVELDQKFLAAANEFFILHSDIYELEDNSTEADDEVNAEVPEYTVDELQHYTESVLKDQNITEIQEIWKKYLEGIFSVSDVTLDFENDKILVSELDLKYMVSMAALVAKTPPVVLELYIWIKVVEVMSIHTTTELRIMFQRSYDDIKNNKGDTGIPPRSLQCSNAVNDMLGMAVAYAMAETDFINKTKPKITAMLYEMKNALAHLVDYTKWMDDDTKLATYLKIIKMKTLIGFPDWLFEEGRLEAYYVGVEVKPETHLENMISIIQVKLKKCLNKFRDNNNYTWATDPTEVNAYHTFQENTIKHVAKQYLKYLDAAVPLVMLQYPFFNLGLDSLNYGSLGTIIGHEITHGFDNYGRRFDKYGNMVPWWSNATVDSFVNMTRCFMEQYNKFYVKELGKYVDGKQTLGENIADNGGVRNALGALKRHLLKNPPEPKLPGFEDMDSIQLFFLSYGNLWCGVTTKDSLKHDLDDEHSPQQFRAIGSLQNSEEFAKAFKCPKGSRMNPVKKCIIF